jgi:catechol 2,3-dioxygenase-like lactoylglutathione lyase family enzyme
MTAPGRVVGVAHTGITTSDMSRSVRLFRDVLGLPVTDPVLYTDPIFERITGIPGANIEVAYVDFPGHKVELLDYKKPIERATSTLLPCDNGHLHLSLLVSGIDDLVIRLEKEGFRAAGPIQSAINDGVRCRAIYTYGPDNLLLELMDFSADS